MPDLSWPELVRRLNVDVTSRLGNETSSRDDEAWTELATHVLKISKIVSRQLGADDHQEIAQETLLRLQSPERLRRMLVSGSPQGFLFVMVRNLAADDGRRRLRDRARRDQDDRTFEEMPSVAPSSQEVIDNRVVVLRAELSRLSYPERQLLKLRFWEELSIVEIARRADEPYSRVAVRLFRLLRRLRGKVAHD